MTIPATRPWFPPDQERFILGAVRKVLRTGRLILGPYTEQLERQFARHAGVPHAVAVSSCTAALEIAFRWGRIAGGEVVIPTNTFVATANAVWLAGGQPVLADIDPSTLCLDVEDLRRRVTRRTRAVVVVHIGGLVHPRIGEIRAFCRQRKLVLVEDAAHAAGATLDGQRAGSFGDVGCFSFYPTKVMTSLVGGMVATRHRGLAEFARSMRHHGVGPGGLLDIRCLGNDFLMDEIRAAVGIAQLRGLERAIRLRRRVASLYDRLLRDLPVAILRAPKGVRHVYYKYLVLLRTAAERRRIAAALRAHDIEVGSLYEPPVHRQPYHAAALGHRNGDFPVADDVLPRVLALPLHPGMTEREVRAVVAALGLALA
jgi:perosamine synthetase